MAIEHGCPIWGTTAQVQVHGDALLVESARAGGKYSVSRTAAAMIGGRHVQEKAKITRWLCDQRHQGVDVPVLNTEVLARIQTDRPLPLSQRRVRVLQALSRRHWRPGMRFAVHGSGPNTPSAMLAATESTDVPDLLGLVTMMEMDGLISRDMDGSAELTPRGFAALEDLQTRGAATSQAFVAMWFDPSMTAAYANAIGPAVTRAGYSPMRIDQKEHANKIDDEIVAEIRKSRFLVADFTCATFKTEAGLKADSRGGVYFEAGLAKGLGMDVIWTCRADCLGQVHFDNRQYAFVVWDDGDFHKFERDLYNRIVAVLGPGPSLGT